MTNTEVTVITGPRATPGQTVRSLTLAANRSPEKTPPNEQSASQNQRRTEVRCKFPDENQIKRRRLKPSGVQVDKQERLAPRTQRVNKRRYQIYPDKI